MLDDHYFDANVCLDQARSIRWWILFNNKVILTWQLNLIFAIITNQGISSLPSLIHSNNVWTESKSCHLSFGVQPNSTKTSGKFSQGLQAWWYTSCDYCMQMISAKFQHILHRNRIRFPQWEWSWSRLNARHCPYVWGDRRKKISHRWQWNSFHKTRNSFRKNRNF